MSRRRTSGCCGRLLFRAYGGDAERVHDEPSPPSAGSGGTGPPCGRWRPRCAPAPHPDHRGRHRLPGPGRARRRDGQERGRRPVLGGARLRPRRDRHGHRAPPAGQRAAAAVPAAGEPRDRQPDGLQQPGRRSAGRPAWRPPASRRGNMASACRSASRSARPRSFRWRRRRRTT